ncbi:MAG: ABC transporter ATP-binding protein/permease [Lachnospiraceae bacterium]|nr:ABC transporter ATP-binding protein/permease [Lachnospiraceae bacterium]
MSKEKKNKMSLKFIKSEISNAWKIMKYFSKIAWKEKKSYFLFYTIVFIISIIEPFIHIFGIKWLVDGVVSENKKEIIVAALLLSVGKVVLSTTGKVLSDKMATCADLIDRKVHMMINDTSMKLRFADTEDPVVLDQMKKANNGYDQVGYSGIAYVFINLVGNIIVLFGVTYLIVDGSVILLAIIITSFLISSYFNGKIAKINYEYFPKIADKERGVDYITNKLTTYQYGKEIRLYDAADMILDRHRKLTKDIVDNEKNKFYDILHIRRVYQVLNNLLTGLVYAVLAIEAVMGKVSVGDFSGLSSAVGTFRGALDGIIGSFFQMQNSAKILGYVIDYFEMADVSNEGTELIVDEHRQPVIEFRNVSFKYPRTDSYVLKNINVKITPGEHIAIVGENGAGKTTFIKLLCRLYQPTDGEILLDGVNINTYRFDEYIKILSVVFQDFKMLAFSFRENIAAGQNSDDEKIMEYCRVSGVEKRIETAPKQLDTAMYKMFEEDGIEPSGGEAQKLAIVRALYKNAPVIILDEPTAALDPISEYQIYSTFNTMVDNRTAVYISHRLSSCKFCDRILVFADNTIIEEGSHDKLMNNENGLYYKMFTVQAQYYKAD